MRHHQQNINQWSFSETWGCLMTQLWIVCVYLEKQFEILPHQVLKMNFMSVQ